MGLLDAASGLGELGGSIIGDLLAQGKYAEAEALRQKALQQYEGLDQYLPKQLERAGRSELDKAQADPQFKQSRLAALNRLQQVGLEGGMDPESRAAMAEAQNQAGQYERGQREAILQDASSRGMLNSNMASTAQLQAQQQGANRLAMEGTQNAASARQRALQALSQSEGIAGGMQRDEYGMARDKAAANDEINLFNTRNANQFNQQQYQNRAGIADRQYGAYRQSGDDSFEEGQRTAQKYRGYGKGLGTVLGGEYAAPEVDAQGRPVTRTRRGGLL